MKTNNFHLSPRKVHFQLEFEDLKSYKWFSHILVASSNKQRKLCLVSCGKKKNPKTKNGYFLKLPH